jgi:hypothetical protein
MNVVYRVQHRNVALRSVRESERARSGRRKGSSAELAASPPAPARQACSWPHACDQCRQLRRLPTSMAAAPAVLRLRGDASRPIAAAAAAQLHWLSGGSSADSRLRLSLTRASTGAAAHTADAAASSSSSSSRCCCYCSSSYLSPGSLLHLAAEELKHLLLSSSSNIASWCS